MLFYYDISRQSEGDPRGKALGSLHFMGPCHRRTTQLRAAQPLLRTSDDEGPHFSRCRKSALKPEFEVCRSVPARQFTSRAPGYIQVASMRSGLITERRKTPGKVAVGKALHHLRSESAHRRSAAPLQTRRCATCVWAHLDCIVKLLQMI